MKKRVNLALAAIVATFASGCGDDRLGGGGGMPGDGDLQVGGIWDGEATVNIVQPGSPVPEPLRDTQVSFFTTEADADGVSQFRLVSDSALQAVGEILVTAGAADQETDNLTGSFTAFAPNGFVFSDGTVTAQCVIDTGVLMETIAGDLQDTRTIMATYTCQDKNGQDTATGDFSGDYNANQYEQPSSFNRVAGTWSGLDFNTTNNNVVLTLRVAQDDGIVDGDNADGCIYAGQIDILDAAFNLYAVTLTVSNCGAFNGTYSGLATLRRGVIGRPDEFIYQVDNGSLILTQAVFREQADP